MANCDHDQVGICKSCRQTIREGGSVAVLLAGSLRAPTTPEMAQIKRTRPKRAQVSEADLKSKKAASKR